MNKLLLIVFFLVSFSAWPYPNFIGYGYNACLTCHYNPFGNGPLNNYGRALSATAISSRAFYKKTTSEEEIASSSGAFFSIPKDTWLKPSFDYRGLVLRRNVGLSNEVQEYIHMQADLNLVVKSPKNKNIYAVFTYGYAPQPLSRKNNAIKEEKFRSREHYIGIRQNKNMGHYLGMMDKVFGIRTADHTLFSRAITDMDQNDQVHAYLFHFYNSNWNLGAQAIAGNLTQDSSLRQKGLSTRLEYLFSNKFTSGFSMLGTKSDYVETKMGALHLKAGFGKGSSILAEFGEVEKTSTQIDLKNHNRYFLLQNHILVFRGFFVVNTFEYFKSNLDIKDKLIRLGPGVQYFPVQRVELRLDVYNTRNFSERFVTRDTWNFLGQIHIWL